MAAQLGDKQSLEPNLFLKILHSIKPLSEAQTWHQSSSVMSPLSFHSQFVGLHSTFLTAETKQEAAFQPSPENFTQQETGHNYVEKVW